VLGNCLPGDDLPHIPVVLGPDGDRLGAVDDAPAPYRQEKIDFLRAADFHSTMDGGQARIRFHPGKLVDLGVDFIQQGSDPLIDAVSFDASSAIDEKNLPAAGKFGFQRFQLSLSEDQLGRIVKYE